MRLRGHKLRDAAQVTAGILIGNPNDGSCSGLKKRAKDRSVGLLRVPWARKSRGRDPAKVSVPSFATLLVAGRDGMAPATGL